MSDIEEIKAAYIKNVQRTTCWWPDEVYNPKTGGQSVGLSPRGVYLESPDSGFAIFVNHERSQIKNYELAYTFFKMYLDETIK